MSPDLSRERALDARYGKRLRVAGALVLTAMVAFISCNVLYTYGVPWWPIRSLLDISAEAMLLGGLVVIVLLHPTGRWPFCAVAAGLAVFVIHTLFESSIVRDWVVAEYAMEEAHYNRMFVETTSDLVSCLNILALMTAFIAATWHKSVSRSRLESMQEALSTVRTEYDIVSDMVDWYERERKLTALELHDGVTQYIVAAHCHSAAAQQALDAPEDPESWNRSKDETAHVELLLLEATREAKHLISGLRPPVLDELGIAAAVEYLAHEHASREDLDVQYTSNLPDGRLNEVLETAIFRIVQESLNNVVKHAATKQAQVALKQVGDEVLVEIRDRGAGFDAGSEAPHGFGLRGIRERCEMLGGSATISSRPGRGTVVSARIPLSRVTSGVLAERGGPTSVHEAA